MNFLYILVFLSTFFVLSKQEEWLDPYDMNINIPNTVLKMNNDKTQQDQLKVCDCPKEINYSISHYKRLINLMLSATNVDTSGVHKGHLYLNIPAEDYDILKSFADDSKSKEDPAILRKLDHILSKSLTKPFYEQAALAFETWMDHIYFTLYSRSTAILLSCIFMVFISYKLLSANFTIWSVVKYLIFVGWITDFAFTWINLLQEAEINRMADSLMYESIPAHCNPNKMNWFQYLKYAISSKSDCRNYHQVVYKDNFWSIAPVTVLSHQFGVLIYTPASHLGQALGTFTSSLLSALPWGINIFLLPFLLLFVAIIICISFSFLTQTSFSINFFHLIRLQFGNEQRRIVGDVLSGHNLSAILNIAHRNMVEDVRQVETPKTDVSNCSKSNSPLQIKDQASNTDEENKGKDPQGCEKCTTCKSEEKLDDKDKCEGISREEIKHDGSGDKALNKDKECVVP